LRVVASKGFSAALKVAVVIARTEPRAIEVNTVGFISFIPEKL
jgi:hypothetical protein